MTKPTILVTGASGFFGSELVSQLVANGFAVRGVVHQRSLSYPEVEYVRTDICDVSKISEALADDTKCVIHAAGLVHQFGHKSVGGERFHQINVEGTVNVTRAAADAGVRHFVLISSVSVYGPFTQSMYDEGASCRPEGPYAESKYQAERCATEIAQSSGMILTILRLATLYGEGDPGNVGRLMRMLDSGRFIWIGNGCNRKSLLYKEDAARACLAAVEAPVNGTSIYNVAAPPCTMREIVDGLADALGKKPLPIRVPASVAMFASRLLSRPPSARFSRLHATVEKWLAEDVYDTRRIEDVIGFRTRVRLAEGLRREVQWYRSQPPKYQLSRRPGHA